jgi:hypothetical protein
MVERSKRSKRSKRLSVGTSEKKAAFGRLGVDSMSLLGHEKRLFTPFYHIIVWFLKRGAFVVHKESKFDLFYVCSVLVFGFWRTAEGRHRFVLACFSELQSSK